MINIENFKVIYKVFSEAVCRNKLDGSIHNYKVIGNFVKIF